MTQPAQDPIGATDVSGDAETASAIARLAEQVIGLREQVAALDRFVNERINAQDARVGLALAASDRAVNKAEAAAEKRFEGVNEFRSQLSDQADTFMTRTEAESRANRNAERIDELVQWRNRTEGSGQGAKDNRAGIYAALGAAVAVIAILVFLASLITAK